MPAIPLERAMVVWTPDTELWRNSRSNAAPAGSIAVVEWPDDRDAYHRYPKSDCAGNRDWNEGSTEFRLQHLARLVVQLVEKENIHPDHVAEAIRIIDLPNEEFANALRAERQRERAARVE